MSLTSCAGCGGSAPCACISTESVLDPATGADPMVRVRFNDGALLDARDFLVEQNAHVWQDRLRALMLHGPGGVIWGLGITTNEDGRVLRVAPGAALDPRGRLLMLHHEVCLDVQRLPAGFVDGIEPEEAEGPRAAYVVLAYEACANDPVTALRPVCAEPVTPAWSRQVDGVRIDLEQAAPAEPIEWMRRWLKRPADAPDDLHGRWAGEEVPTTDRRSRWLEISMGLAERLPQVWEDDVAVPLLLAEVAIIAVDDQWRVDTVDPSGRALLPPAQWVAEESLGVPLASGAVAGPHPVEALQVAVVAPALEVLLSGPLDPASVTVAAIDLLRWEAGAWTAVPATVATSGTTLSVTPDAEPAAGTALQLLVRGTGPNAVIGATGAPFIGDAAPSSLSCARDITLFVTWS